MTCDQSCTISAGLMSASVSSVCNAVKNDVTSCGERDGGASFAIPDATVPDGGLGRPNVCRSEANFVCAVLGGVGGRLGSAEWGVAMFPLITGDPGVDVLDNGAGFFLLDWNVLRSDHSDSN